MVSFDTDSFGWDPLNRMSLCAISGCIMWFISNAFIKERIDPRSVCYVVTHIFIIGIVVGNGSNLSINNIHIFRRMSGDGDGDGDGKLNNGWLLGGLHALFAGVLLMPALRIRTWGRGWLFCCVFFWMLPIGEIMFVMKDYMNLYEKNDGSNTFEWRISFVILHFVVTNTLVIFALYHWYSEGGRGGEGYGIVYKQLFISLIFIYWGPIIGLEIGLLASAHEYGSNLSRASIAVGLESGMLIGCGMAALHATMWIFILCKYYYCNNLNRDFFDPISF